MKRIITIMLLCLTGVGWGQEVKKEKVGSTSRISFVMGIGSSVAFDNVHQMPVVSPLDNNVKMEAGQRGRVSATFGISYTPYVYKITDKQNPEGYFATRGISFVAFFNPLNLSKSSNLEESFSLNNFGLGIGYKSITGFGVYLVGEIASIKQPRQWFINEFQNGDKSYEINGQIQNAFSSSDESIFRNKLIPYVGIKACYTFDILKKFSSAVAPDNNN
ncbi:MAG: hypothetical protein GX163_05900 [Bacteroidetes bacterium]|nr:hypothetical protein [Bacteroidota bacterium]